MLVLSGFTFRKTKIDILIFAKSIYTKKIVFRKRECGEEVCEGVKTITNYELRKKEALAIGFV